VRTKKAGLANLDIDTEKRPQHVDEKKASNSQHGRFWCMRCQMHLVAVKENNFFPCTS
jgi:hypothetical protein